eukprot:c2074_g1_i1.p1 GENE.c2074_g1_i1~~c2074_g1_i1.p1  ORF type:complete len:420 (-),score=90.44 c2074_g1_i1:291-1550(-)
MDRKNRAIELLDSLYQQSVVSRPFQRLSSQTPATSVKNNTKVQPTNATKSSASGEVQLATQPKSPAKPAHPTKQANPAKQTSLIKPTTPENLNKPANPVKSVNPTKNLRRTIDPVAVSNVAPQLPNPTCWEESLKASTTFDSQTEELASSVRTSTLAQTLTLPTSETLSCKSTEEQFLTSLVNDVLAGRICKGKIENKDHIFSSMASNRGSSDVFQTRIQDKVLSLDNIKELSQQKVSHKHHRPHLVVKETAKVRKLARQRQHKHFGAARHTYRFDEFQSLHKAWQSYTSEVVRSLTKDEILAQCAHLDFHGAIFTVVRAGRPELVGIHGIVVQETSNVFRIVDSHDRCHGNFHSYTVSFIKFEIWVHTFSFVAKENKHTKIGNISKQMFADVPPYLFLLHSCSQAQQCVQQLCWRNGY